MPWIKVRTNLVADPRVEEIARSTGTTTQHVVGALVALWSFADEHSTDGRLSYVRRTRIDAFCGTEGYAYYYSSFQLRPMCPESKLAHACSTWL